MDKETAKQIVQSAGWLASVPETFAERLLEKAILVRIAPDQYLYRRDDPAGGIYGIAKGAVLIEVATPQEEGRLIGCFRRGAWIGQAPSLTGSARTMAFQAVGNVAALHLPLPTLGELIESDAEATRILGSLSEWNLDLALRSIADLTIARAERRIAARLLGAANYPFGMPEDEGWLVELSQAQLAEIANASRDNVSRCIAKFRRRGWLKSGYRKVILCDPEAIDGFVSADSD